MIMADHNINWGRAAVSMGTTRLQTLRHKSTLPSKNKREHTQCTKWCQKY